MNRGSHRAVVFTPLAAPAESAESRARLYEPPEDHVLVLGEMLRDVRTIGEKLGELPFADGEYRGDLRVVLAAAKRIAQRCRKLLGEEEKALAAGSAQ